MNRVAIAILAAALLPGFQETLPEAKLKPLKAATLFVRQFASSGSTAGPGFVFHRTGDSCLIASSLRTAGGARGIRSFMVIQHSGTPDERKFPAELVGEDPDFDLVILKASIPDAPEPIPFPAKAALQETMPVFVLGFPLDEAMGKERKNPPIAIAKGTIGSLRKDPRGELVRIQLDADAGFGNSGAPVVDRAGNLLGLAGGTLQDTKISTAIPAKVLEDITGGRAFRAELTVGENKDGMMSVQVSVGLHDPGNRLKSVSILSIRRDQVTGDLPADPVGTWDQAAADMKETPLTIRGGKAVGQVILQGDAREDLLYLCQVKQVRVDGQVRHTGPWEFNAAFSSAGGAVQNPGARPARRAADDDWLGSDEERKKWAGGRVEGEATGKPYDVKRTLTDGLEVVSLPSDIMGGVSSPHPVFSSDGKVLYYFSSDLSLVKVRLPDFVEERRVLVGRPVIRSGWTKEGLALQVSTTDQQFGASRPGDVWIFNEDTLERIRQVTLPDTDMVLFLPGQGHAILYRDTRIRMLDLKTGATFKETTVDKATAKTRWFAKPVNFRLSGFLDVSPDGRFAYMTSANVGSIGPVRIDVEDAVFKFDEVGADIGPIRFYFGHPEARFAVVRTTNVSKIKGHPDLKGTGVYVYKATDFSKALCVIPDAQPLCGSSKNGQFWALHTSGELVLYDSNGKKTKGWFPFPAGQYAMEVRLPSNENAFLAKIGVNGAWSYVRLANP